MRLPKIIEPVEIMKKYKMQLKHLVLIIFAVLVTGCSWFSDSTEPVNESYEAGKKALEEGNYEIAKSHFREISPESTFYPQAIWMIQKVPFKKGVAAFEQKQYQIAISELSKVPLHSPDYAESRRYLKLVNLALLNKQFLNVSGQDRFVLVQEIIDIADELADSKLIFESVDLIYTGLDQSTSSRHTRDLIILLGSVVSTNKDLALQQKALNYLLTDFEQLYKHSEVRPEVFRIIGNLKLEMM
jgi:tetratricopeptide (TPR) repeat protein